jgi:hypothetical protein
LETFALPAIFDKLDNAALASRSTNTCLDRGGCMRGLILAVCAAFFLSSCASMPDEQRNVLIGIVAGAGAGALIGSAVATGGGSIAVAAAVGGATGGAIASMIKPNYCYFLNRRGELWQVPCSHPPAWAQACFYGTGPGMLQAVDCPHGRPGRSVRQATVDTEPSQQMAATADEE